MAIDTADKNPLPTDHKTRDVGSFIADLIHTQIAPLFKADRCMEITVICRSRVNPESYMVVTKDDVDKLIATLVQSKTPVHETLL